MPDNNKTISIRQKMIDRIFTEENLLQNLSHHYGTDVEAVKTWITDLYSDEMIRDIIVGLDWLEKAQEELEKNQGIMPPSPHKKGAF
jgi:hypothetical protein